MKLNVIWINCKREGSSWKEGAGVADGASRVTSLAAHMSVAMKHGAALSRWCNGKPSGYLMKRNPQGWWCFLSDTKGGATQQQRIKRQQQCCSTCLGRPHHSPKSTPPVRITTIRALGGLVAALREEDRMNAELHSLETLPRSHHRYFESWYRQNRKSSVEWYLGTCPTRQCRSGCSSPSACGTMRGRVVCGVAGQ